MMRALLVLVALSAGCKQSRCEDIQAAPVAGLYKGGGSLGEDRLLRVAVDTSGKKVVLTYAMMDGSRIRATYRIGKKSKQR
ncbi:MAG TPA: hypothetical protein VFX59_00580 [Polyangiales bacterium]|nr:hypothetical protein [Polyangiales bacterium]